MQTLLISWTGNKNPKNPKKRFLLLEFCSLYRAISKFHGCEGLHLHALQYQATERRQAVGGDERERQSLLAFSSLPHHGDSKVVLAASESWRRLE